MSYLPRCFHYLLFIYDETFNHYILSNEQTIKFVYSAGLLCIASIMHIHGIKCKSWQIFQKTCHFLKVKTVKITVF